MNKIISILKFIGMIFYDVVSRVRKILNIKKVGYIGIFDLDVLGVLLICIGKVIKVCEVILNKDKLYICEFILGISIDIYDVLGEILKKVDDFKFSNEDIERVFDI